MIVSDILKKITQRRIAASQVMCPVVLACPVSCIVVLRCVVICRVVLSYIVSYSFILSYIVLCCLVLIGVVLCCVAVDFEYVPRESERCSHFLMSSLTEVGQNASTISDTSLMASDLVLS